MHIGGASKPHRSFTEKSAAKDDNEHLVQATLTYLTVTSLPSSKNVSFVINERFLPLEI
jgi:hypothetical protein